MAIRSGVYSLPVELLSRIFVVGAAAQSIDTPFILRPDEDHCIGSVTDFQLLVSHVCKHWREIALRISCLWTSLHFREPAHIARANTFLARVATIHALDILVDTVAISEHIPGVTLCHEEMRTIFALIIPHVARWRAFHLKVRANDCKLIARQELSTCGPAPRLETLQLYHFEDYRTNTDLYIATYRPPVEIFDNSLPALRNVSLIGVNLPWARAPYLQQLHTLELALHPDNIRPPFQAWDKMLRRSPLLRRLHLHYSGPRAADDHSSRICMPALEDLELTDLDPDHLTRLLHTLELPRLATLSLDLPEQDLITPSPVQDFSSAVELMAIQSPYAALHTLHITALDCASFAFAAFLRALVSLSVLKLDFSRIRDPNAICDVLLDTILLPFPSSTCPLQRDCPCEGSRCIPVLPRLEEASLFGLSGRQLRAIINFRMRFSQIQEPSSATIDEVDFSPSSVHCSTSCSPKTSMPRFVVRWTDQIGDPVLEQLVQQGRVNCLNRDDDGEDDVEDIWSENGDE
ncbi:F-box domain-containing protein [Favolaschia claudopus]|uniref:F-box domain-containing protein n=1 Tax=Favolaschia claudopus TaxID=2862362 RepID=A0AAW0DAT3_9AGAR